MRMMMFVPPQSWPKRDEVDDMYEDEDDNNYEDGQVDDNDDNHDKDDVLHLGLGRWCPQWK